jgi:hypothetical protein
VRSYLDNINIDAVIVNTGVAHLTTTIKVNVVPNPAFDKCTVQIALDKALQTEVELYDVIGQKVWSHDLGVVRNASETVSRRIRSRNVYRERLKAVIDIILTRIVKQ